MKANKTQACRIKTAAAAILFPTQPEARRFVKE
jgi:hypothetical protein